MKVRTDVRTYVVRTDVHDVMAIKPNFLTSMGYHIFLTMVLRARSQYSYLRAPKLKPFHATQVDLSMSAVVKALTFLSLWPVFECGLDAVCGLTCFQLSTMIFPSQQVPIF